MFTLSVNDKLQICFYFLFIFNFLMKFFCKIKNNHFTFLYFINIYIILYENLNLSISMYFFWQAKILLEYFVNKIKKIFISRPFMDTLYQQPSFWDLRINHPYFVFISFTFMIHDRIFSHCYKGKKNNICVLAYLAHILLVIRINEKLKAL